MLLYDNSVMLGADCEEQSRRFQNFIQSIGLAFPKSTPLSAYAWFTRALKNSQNCGVPSLLKQASSRVARG
jgi:hypothetical protein